jgi:hypothetical protein
MHRPELSRKPLVGEKGALRAISCIPGEGEPDYYRMEESERDGSYGVRLWTIRMPKRLELSLVAPGSMTFKHSSTGFRITRLARHVSGSIVLSFDGNHLNSSVGLETEYVPHSDDRRLLESQFFGSNKVHRLRDAFLDRSFEYTSTDTGRSRSEGRGAACSLLRTGTYGESDRRPFRLRLYL